MSLTELAQKALDEQAKEKKGTMSLRELAQKVLDEQAKAKASADERVERYEAARRTLARDTLIQRVHDWLHVDMDISSLEEMPSSEMGDPHLVGLADGFYFGIALPERINADGMPHYVRAGHPQTGYWTIKSFSRCPNGHWGRMVFIQQNGEEPIDMEELGESLACVQRGSAQLAAHCPRCTSASMQKMARDRFEVALFGSSMEEIIGLVTRLSKNCTVPELESLTTMLQHKWPS